MKPQTFTASNLQDAIGKVRESFGASAKIISWREVQGGIEVTAMAPNGAEIKREKETDNYSVQIGSAPRYDVFAYEEELAKKGKENTNDANLTNPAFAKKGIEILAKKKAKPFNQSIEAKAHIKPENPAIKSINPPKPGIHSLIPLLVKSGMELRQIKPFAKYFDIKDNLACLIKIFENEIKFSPIDAVPSNIIALFGNAGSGKTIGCAKLAARVLASGGRALLISTDTERQGGAQQLSALANKLGADFEYADNLTHAKNLAQRAHSNGVCVFIDCPAASVFDPSSLRFSQKLIEEIGCEGVLCLNADARADDLTDTAMAFEGIGIERVILTRFDLTKRRAGVIPALLTSKLKVAQISPSPYIAGGLALGTAKRLAQLILEPWD